MLQYFIHILVSISSIYKYIHLSIYCYFIYFLYSIKRELSRLLLFVALKWCRCRRRRWCQSINEYEEIFLILLGTVRLPFLKGI